MLNNAAGHSDHTRVGASSKLMREAIEAKTFIDNFLIVLEKTYNLSVKQESLGLIPKWKSEGWVKHEH